MKRKLPTGVFVALGIAVTVLNPPMSGILAVGVWIYLVRMVRKQKHDVLDEQMEPTIAKWYLTRVKALLIVAGFFFLVFVVGAIVHNVVRDLSETEQTASLLIALVALSLFIGATAGAIAMFLTKRQRRLTPS